MATKLFDPIIFVAGGAADLTKPVDTRQLPAQITSASASAPPPAPP